LTVHPTHFALAVIELDEHSVRLEVGGEIDLVSAPEFGEVLRQQVIQGRDVLLDFSHAVFMDSSGVKALVGAIQLCEGRRNSLVVEGELPHQIRRLFEITRIDTVLPTVRP
jgi:anti-anti-sigma factor